MLNLIHADLYKMRKSIAMRILFAITMGGAVTMTIFAYLIPRGRIAESYTGLGFLFSDINMMGILGAVAAGILICGDFENKTIHDAIASGCSRSNVIFSKAVSFFIAIVILLLPYAIITAIALLSTAKFGMGSVGVGFLHMLSTDGGTALDVSVFFKMLAVMLALILAYIAQLSLCVPFALVFKKPLIVIVVYYSATILCAQLYGLENASKVFGNIFSYTPYGGNHLFLSLGTQAGEFGKTIIVSLVFLTAMMAVTYGVFRKIEIK